MDNRNAAPRGTGGEAGGWPGAVSGPPSLAERRAEAKPYAVWLYIWGMEWLLSAAIQFFDPGDAYAAWRMAVLLAAAAASAAVLLLRHGKQTVAASGTRTAAIGAVLPVLACALIAAVLLQTGIVSPLYMPLLKGMVLAVVYGMLSLKLGRPLLYMGLWMLALTLTVAYAYLGYASVLLGGFGGLSLLAFGLMVSIWDTLWKKEHGVR